MRQRNHITRLPAETRSRISMLLDDGATYDEVRNDPEVAEVCNARGLVLHDTTFGAWLRGEEHRGYVEARHKYGTELERRKLAAFVVGGGGADDLARIASFEVLKRVLARLEDGNELETAELRSLAASLAGYERNRIAEEAAEARRQVDRETAKYQARIAELESKVMELSAEKVRNGMLSDEQVDEIRRRLGL